MLRKVIITEKGKCGPRLGENVSWNMKCPRWEQQTASQKCDLLKRSKSLDKNTAYASTNWEIYKNDGCGLWQTVMKCHLRDDDETGKSNPSFLSPALPGGWYLRWKNEMFKDWASFLKEKEIMKKWGHEMVEARQDDMSHAHGRNQDNNYRIATRYTGNKQSFYTSTLKHLS